MRVREGEYAGERERLRERVRRCGWEREGECAGERERESVRVREGEFAGEIESVRVRERGRVYGERDWG